VAVRVVVILICQFVKLHIAICTEQISK